LGKLTDSEIARRMKISRRKVSAKRQILGIASPQAATQAKRWNPDTLELLGAKADDKIAKKLKISPAAVASKRRQLGIAAYRG
jgi:DNA-binding CsgD family transcriptional regulator